MDKLIPLINSLQDVFAHLGLTFIDLPQIAVVGAQSSGKSSVLENVVGIDFLPRGSGIVTRRPLVLQLYNQPGSEEWAEFLHAPGRKWYNFEEVRQEIVADTDRITGGNLGISNNPINLKIYSPNVVNLTLVDLPGLTKVPVGNQPADIDQQIRNMVLHHISKKNTIILAVTAANTDLANSDALQLGKQVDPEGDRTVGVLTKLDLMDHGTDAGDILAGKTLPLKRGYIGIVNRSQKDINDRRSMANARQKESEYFHSHPVYSQMMHLCGTSVLSTTLNKILIQHIKTNLPEIRRTVESKLDGVMKELDELGGPRTDDKKTELVKLLKKYANEFRSMIEGKSQEVWMSNPGELKGGARIRYIFTDIFVPAIQELNPLEGLKDEEIINVIRNGAGVSGVGTMLVPRIVISLIQRTLERFKDPSQECIKLVRDELIKISTYCGTKPLSRYEDLRSTVLNEVTNYLNTQYTLCLTKVNNIIEMQMSFINLEHPECQRVIMAINQDPSLLHKKDGFFKKTEKFVKSIPIPDVGKKDPSRDTSAVNPSESQRQIAGQTKAGWLEKQGANFKGWKKRYFLYDGTYFHWFNTDQKGEKARGSLAMRDAQVREINGKDGFVFMVRTREREMCLRTETDKERREWVAILNSSNAQEEAKDEEDEDAKKKEDKKKKDKEKEEEEQREKEEKEREKAAKKGRDPDPSKMFGGNFTQPPKPVRKVVNYSAGSSSPAKRQPRRRGGSLLGRYPVPEHLQIHLPDVPFSIRPPVAQRELQMLATAKAQLGAYFHVVRKIVRDLVPKASMTFMVNETKLGMSFLVGVMSAKDNLDELMRESSAVAAQRDKLDQQLKALQRAQKILQEAQNLDDSSIAQGTKKLDLPPPGSLPSFAPAPAPPLPARPTPTQGPGFFPSGPAAPAPAPAAPASGGFGFPSQAPPQPAVAPAAAAAAPMSYGFPGVAPGQPNPFFAAQQAAQAAAAAAGQQAVNTAAAVGTQAAASHLAAQYGIPQGAAAAAASAATPAVANAMTNAAVAALASKPNPAAYLAAIPGGMTLPTSSSPTGAGRPASPEAAASAGGAKPTDWMSMFASARGTPAAGGSVTKSPSIPEALSKATPSAPAMPQFPFMKK